MFKSIPLPGFVSGTFFTFWVLHCLYAVACVFGPFIFSGLNEVQKQHQSNLFSFVLLGIFVPPVVHLLMKFVPALSSQSYLCLAAPLFPGLSVYSTVAMFRAEEPTPYNLTIDAGKSASYEGLTVTYESHQSESATTGPGEPETHYAVYVLGLSAQGEKETLRLPVETEAAPYHDWKSYRVKVWTAKGDHSTIGVFVLKAD